MAAGVGYGQVMEIRAVTASGTTASGSGYRIGGRLVLTAAHVVFNTDGTARRDVAVQSVSEDGCVPGRVVWPARRGDIDAALIEIDGGVEPAGCRPVRWGRLTGQAGRVACEALGFPRVVKDLTTGDREVEHLTGRVHPGSGLRAGRYALVVDGVPPLPPANAVAKSPWAGMSGAAVFAGGLLIGLVALDDPRFAHSRLTVVPAAVIVAAAGFTDQVGSTGRLPVASVELAGLFPAPVPVPARLPSPATLLQPRWEVVPFDGREGLRTRLAGWCAEPAEVSVWLVHGPGGQGKTRLARQVCAEREAAGWVTGLIRKPVSVDRDEGDAAFDEALGRIADSQVPVLLAVDYAETRVATIGKILEGFRQAGAAGRLRLLLLARSAGRWWTDRLSDDLDRLLVPAHAEYLDVLDAGETDRPGRFRDAVTALAGWLPRVDPAVDWTAVAAAVRVTPPVLAGERFRSVFAVHMAGLAALLEQGRSPHPGGGAVAIEDRILAHEADYWERFARTRGLPYEPATLRSTVVTATLCGAADEPEAIATIGRVPLLDGIRKDSDRRLAVASWLHELHPAETGGGSGAAYWAGVAPDRLAEHLVAVDLAADRHELAGRVLADASPGQAVQALTVLMRARVHQPGASDEARRLVRAYPGLLGAAALIVAQQVDDPSVLLTAVAEVVPRLTVEQVRLLVYVLPERSLILDDLAMKITTRAVDLLRGCAVADPDAVLPDLAGSLNNLSGRLASLGRREE
ncbi:serine protease, partial [Frankia sp. CiP3]|uniref:serine protease n=1 Tax=Frankia sp. CiP3 TaxID=2880971 RepID=UPI001EF6180F